MMDMNADAVFTTPRAQLAHNRVHAVIDGRCPDRIPFSDSYWAEFRTRYVAERGLPADTSLFHLTRLNHMVLSCVGCGMCTQACPAELPVGSVFRSIGQRLQETFEYIPGRSLEEPLPLITFKENEWTDLGEE